MGLDEHIKKGDIRGVTFTALMTALAFVAGLFWNDAIRSAIEVIIPPSDKLGAKFVAAIVVTVIVVVIGVLLMKTQQLGEKYGKGIEQLVKKQQAVIDRQRKQMEEQEKRLKRELEKGIR